MAKYTSKFTGEEIDNLLDEVSGKFGHIEITEFNEERSTYIMHCYASREDFEAGKEPLQKVEIPISTAKGRTYAASFKTLSKYEKVNIVVDNQAITIPINYRSLVNDPIEGIINAGIKGTLIVQRATDTTTYETIDTLVDYLESQTEADSYIDFDITKYLAQGKQSIRLQASYDYDDNGERKTARSTFINVGSSITKTSLQVVLTTDYSLPQSAYDVNGAVQPLRVDYRVYGACDKTLHYKITGLNNDETYQDSGISYASEDGIIKSISINDDPKYGFLEHGIRHFEVWLEASDGLGGTLKSEVVTNSFMMVNKQSASYDASKKYLLLQNVKEEVTNFIQTTLLQYAVYVEDGSSTELNISLTDTKGNPYTELKRKAEANKPYDLVATVEIEIADNAGVDGVATRMYILRDGDNNFIEETYGAGTKFFSVWVDNREAITPITGATFLLDPKNRNNDDADKNVIYNTAANNAVVEATFSNFGFMHDGWVTDEYGYKVLRIMAGQTLTIKRNIWANSGFLTNPKSALTIDIDFRVRNVTDVDNPIININGGGTKGVIMNAMKGWVRTASYNDNDNCMFGWREDQRTYVSINLNPSVEPKKKNVDDVIYPATSEITANGSMSLARVLINGYPDREITFNSEDNASGEWCTDPNAAIVIGNAGADIDIYSIRIYEGKSLDWVELMNRNYLSSIPTTEEKMRIKRRNSIFDGNRITIEKAAEAGINYIVYHGSRPYANAGDDIKGWIEYARFDQNGKKLNEYSGTNCKSRALLPIKGQGSTAKTYYDWNMQDDNSKIKDYDAKHTIQVHIDDFHESISVSAPYNGSIEEDDAVIYSGMVVDITGGNLGKDYPLLDKTKPYPYDESTKMVTVPDGWIDGNGKYRGKGYMVAEGTSLAQKKVSKINYASSMQSHLLGACKSYDELHRAVVGATPMQKQYEDKGLLRPVVAKHTEPFLMFWQKDDKSPAYYTGLCIYGAGKMDKVSWGYVKSEHENFCMIEGADNNLPLTDFRVPFDHEVTPVLDDDGEIEGWKYAGKTSLDYDEGKKSKDKTQAADNIIKLWSRVHNFIYLNSTNIRYYDGTETAFLANQSKHDEKYKYWCTQGSDSAPRRLFRARHYETTDTDGKNVTKVEWVDAGLWDEAMGAYSVVDIKTDIRTAATFAKYGKSGNWDVMNDALIADMTSFMKNHGEYLINYKSLLFCYCYVLMFLAGTDNSSKNTYFVIDPIAQKMERDEEFAAWFKSTFGYDFDFDAVYQMYLHGDDMDSILPTNNKGNLTKPYHLERRYPYAGADADKTYREGNPDNSLYEGMHNQLFNFVEYAYNINNDVATSLQSMLKSVFIAANGLVTDDDILLGTNTNKKSTWGFLHKYFFNVQNYFPQIAYIEQARIRYEFPHMMGHVGARGVRPISQSTGAQLEYEQQFMEQRIIYMASYAQFGEICAVQGQSAYSLGLADAIDSLTFQAAPLPNHTATNPQPATISFTLTPHQYIYPFGFNSGTPVPSWQRTSPKQTCQLTIASGITSVTDDSMGLRGVNYYTDLGDFGDKSITSAITISGKRLTKVVASASTSRAFRPSDISIKSENIETIDIYKSDSTGVTSTIDLTKQVRLKSINARSNLILRQVIFPKSTTLTSVSVYAQIHMVDDMPNLQKYTPYNAQYANEIYIGSNVGNIDTKPIVTDIYSSTNPRLTSIHIENIDWIDFPIETLMWYANIPTCEFLGKIAIKEESELQNAVTWDYKNKLNLKFGNVDDKTSSDYRGLLLTYAQRALTSAKLNGNFYNDGKGEYQFSVTPNSGFANSQTKIHYSISNPQNVDCSMDAVTGVLSVNMSALPEVETFVDVIVRISRYYEGARQEDIVETKQVKVYNRQAELGDLVYADGTFSSVDDWDETKTPIGVCFYIAPRYKTGNNKGDIVEELFNPKDKQQRLMLALDRMTMTSKAGTTTTNPAWGVHKDQSDANGIFGTVDGTRKYLKLQSGQLDETTFYDIPTITNLGSSGLQAGPVNNSANYIEEANFRDEVSERGILNDGFLPIKASTACGDGFAYEETAAELTARTLTADLAKLAGGDYKAGDVVNSGYAKTLKIIEHRNKILSGSPIAEGMTRPIYQEKLIPEAGSGFSEMDSLAELLDDIAEWAYNELKDEYPNKWKQLYYPAASMAYAYEPKVTLKQGEVLADRFKAHNWFLPSNGMLARIFWYQKLSSVNIFEKVTTKGVFKAYPSSNYWSSAENLVTSAWYVYFYNGSTGGNNKYNTNLIVGAVAAF